MILTKLLIVLQRCCRMHTLPNPVLRAHSARNTRLQIFNYYFRYILSIAVHFHGSRARDQEETVQYREE